MRQTALLAVVLLAGSPAFALDSQLLNLAMPNATELAGINVAAVRDSPLGQYLLSRVPPGEPGLQQLIETTGFDPRQDLSEVLLAAALPGSKTGIILARGSFDVQKITAAAKNQQVQTYDGATLMTSTDSKHQGAVAFIGTSIAIAGNTTQVKAALDRQNTANSVDPNLAAQAETLSNSRDAWFFSIAPVASLIPPGAGVNASANQIASMLRNIQSFGGGVKFADPNANIAAQAITDTAENAKALGDVARLLIVLATANASSNAQSAAISQLLQSVQIATDSTAANFSLTVPEVQIEGVLNVASAHRQAAAPHPRRWRTFHAN